MIAALGAQAIKPRGIETMLHAAMYLLIMAGLALGIYGAIDAVRNYKGPNNG
jgi:hypothetical protein